MNARRARRSVWSALVVVVVVHGASGCSRDSASASPAAEQAISAPSAPPVGAANPAAYSRADAPKLRVVPAGLRVLSIRGRDGGAPSLATRTFPNAPENRKPFALGERLEAGEKLHVPAGVTLATRSALEGLELELTGPLALSILDDETVLLAEGELKVLGSPRAPAMIATPDGFVTTPPGTVVVVRKGTTVTPAAAGLGTGTAVATSGEQWESKRVTAPLVLSGGGGGGARRDPLGLVRCRTMAERARHAWSFAAADAGAEEARREAWARQTEARSLARSACAVARLLVDRQPDAGSSLADLDAANTLWRELPGPTP